VIQAVLTYLLETKVEATFGRRGPYNDGYLAAIDDATEFVRDLMWENGVDEDE
jgi:hypothetical protein